jgi:hypothetical protein
MESIMRRENDFSKETAGWLTKEADREQELLTARKEYRGFLLTMGFSEKEADEEINNNTAYSTEDLYMC